jgi:hypothetical protein
MKVITAIDENYSVLNHHNIKVFLAGGITNCPDWQQDAIDTFKMIEAYDFTLYNPRRKNFPIGDPMAAEQQIAWEYEHLEKADIILYWFSKGSLNPIVLYELGRWGNSSNKIISIGCDEGYERTQDVTIQTRLSRPYLEVFTSLQDTVQNVIDAIIQVEDDADGQC